MTPLAADAAEIAADLTALRHRLHRTPEVGLQLPRTQQVVLEQLDGLGLQVSTGRELTSVTAVLRGGTPGGPVVLLRADMDALPVQEQTGVDYASRVPGVMHACGHDLHTTMLLGAARLLASRRESLPGDVLLMFQPGEEGWDGAGRMLDEGVLDAAGSRPIAAYGLHVLAASVPRAVVATRPGTLMAASDELRVVVRGAGGHGSAPHRAKDPISVAAQLVGDLQTMVTRQFDVFDPVVVTVGRLSGGTKRNIIPDEAGFEATVRSFSPQARERVREASVRLCRSVAQAYGLEADVEYREEYPVTVNDHVEAAFAAQVAAEVLGPQRSATLPNPITGAEDFSRVLQQVPGAFLFLGACPDPDGHLGAPDNHSPRATFTDDVLPDGALLLAELAARALAR